MVLKMKPKIKYKFSGKIWQHASAGWYFVSLPKDYSEEIRENLQWQEEGWGRMKASASISDYEWDTSIWFDSKTGVYVLPLKAVIRKKFSLEIDDLIEVVVLI